MRTRRRAPSSRAWRSASTAADIATIAAWVDGGAPLGNPSDLPPAPADYRIKAFLTDLGTGLVHGDDSQDPVHGTWNVRYVPDG